MPISTATLANRPFVGVVEYFSGLYCIKSGVIRNTHAGTVSITKDNMSMLPVKWNSPKIELVAAASINTANALLLEADGNIVSLATATDSTVTGTVLMRGPAVVNESAIKLLDAAGAAITLATVKTALLAVSPPIETQANGANTVTAPT